MLGSQNVVIADTHQDILSVEYKFKRYQKRRPITLHVFIKNVFRWKKTWIGIKKIFGNGINKNL